MKYIEEWGINRVTSKFVINEEESVTRIVNKVLPQEGVLNSTLYNIYTSDITKGIKKEIQTLQYADGIAIYGSSKNLKKGRKEIEKDTID